VSITSESVAPQWDGRRLTSEILADTVSSLLWLEDRARREAAAANSTVRTAERDPEYEADYPDVIVIDDEDNDDLAVA
jgi:hypothetical protein